MKRLWRVGLVVLAALVGVAAPSQAGPVKASKEPLGVYRLEVRIDVPPDYLYPYLIEEDRIARWQHDDSVTVTLPNGFEPRVGKRIHVAIDAPTSPWLLMEIRVLDRPREVRTEIIDGMLTGDFAYLLTPVAGGTSLVNQMRVRPVGTLTTIIWEIFGKHLQRAKMKLYMGRIKQIVEADYQADAAKPAPEP